MGEDNKNATKKNPFNTDPICSELSQKEFFTAEEAAKFLEPRIRSMFK